MTSVWTKDHISTITEQPYTAVPVITADNVKPLAEGLVFWDMWPVQLSDGSIAQINDGALWMLLSAPDRGDPALRHFEAKVRLMHYAGGVWRDLGPALPEMMVSYEREWAGTALLQGDVVTLFFTAAGRADIPGGYQQQLFETHGRLQDDGRITDWTFPVISVENDGAHYPVADQQSGEPGKITAFRDPAYFCDPADGQEYLIFSASVVGSASAYRGAMGIARKTASSKWELLPALIHADGVNNELERAHVVAHEGRYYAFWSTQASTFNPDGPIGPTGLYGMVANSLFGQYEPLNETGLVLANPKEEPSQTYSWHVTKELLVSSFIDHWGLKGRSLTGNPSLVADSFGGTAAPFLRIALTGNQSQLAVTCDNDKLAHG
ncbi:glycoside hydrolase family 68 protein [Sphingorhabdus arenilitoris]|uniref:Glycoside hydrolase family 68 protein n=1 Tax=Sphingorhabdus arenilitoris TaxID=1490041 RepID=A0ABV8RJF2_9SPHN